MSKRTKPYRGLLSVIGTSFIISYVFTMIYNGSLLVNLFVLVKQQEWVTLLLISIPYGMGLMIAGYLVSKDLHQRRLLTISGVFVVLASLFLFTRQLMIMNIALVFIGLGLGLTVSAIGYFMKMSITKENRISTAATILILTFTLYSSYQAQQNLVNAQSTFIIMLIVFSVGVLLFTLIDFEKEEVDSHPAHPTAGIVKPLVVLFVFIAIISVSQSFLDFVITSSMSTNPLAAIFTHLIFYGLAIFLVLFMSFTSRYRSFLYIAMFLLSLSSLIFSFSARNEILFFSSAISVTLASGIFNIFWYTIILEFVELTRYPMKIFAVGHLARVVGIFAGKYLAQFLLIFRFSTSELGIISLLVVVILLMILPSLYFQLSTLIADHHFLVSYNRWNKSKQKEFVENATTLNSLTTREKEILEHILSGKSNKAIAEVLFISESTVKTHVSNILNKYNFSSRAELISHLLNQ